MTSTRNSTAIDHRVNDGLNIRPRTSDHLPNASTRMPVSKPQTRRLASWPASATAAFEPRGRYRRAGALAGGTRPTMLPKTTPTATMLATAEAVKLPVTAIPNHNHSQALADKRRTFLPVGRTALCGRETFPRRARRTHNLQHSEIWPQRRPSGAVAASTPGWPSPRLRRKLKELIDLLADVAAHGFHELPQRWEPAWR